MVVKRVFVTSLTEFCIMHQLKKIIVVNAQNIKNSKNQKFHTFGVKHLFFLLIVQSVVMIMIKYSKKRNLSKF